MKEVGSTADVRVSLLGGFSVTIDGEPVEGSLAARQSEDAGQVAGLTPLHRLHRDVVVRSVMARHRTAGRSKQSASNRAQYSADAGSGIGHTER